MNRGARAGCTQPDTLLTLGLGIPSLDCENRCEHGSIGATATFDVGQGTIHTATLTANLTAAFANPPTKIHTWTMTLFLTQDATGSRTVTWPASVKWPGGTAPTLTTTAAKLDIFTFVSNDGGVTWQGFTTGLNY